MAIADDLRAALRALRRGGSFTWAAVVMLALGVGATTAMFSVVNGVLLRPLALRQPGQLFMLGQRVPQITATPDFNWFASPPEFQAWQREATDFSAITELQSSTFTLAGSGTPRLLYGAKVSTNFFNVLDVPVALGRNFAPADQHDTTRPMVITDQLWRSVFGADPGVLGRSVGLGSAGATIIGVLPPWFEIKGRELGPMLDGAQTQYFVPLVIPPQQLASADVMTNFNYTVIGRLRPGATREQALAQLNVIEARLVSNAKVNL
ncbi:MAG: ABC transporter permease, partial [Terriglobales bacterium]